MSSSHITRYDVMPIPPIPEHTEFFDAGPLRIGVQYRLLSQAIADASPDIAAHGSDSAGPIGEDCGVALHVFGSEEDGTEAQEFLRFDCFREDPHYHYVDWGAKSNQMIHLDPVADGDPLAWALERIRTRLPQMLERAGAPALARRVDADALERALPRITEAAYRLRYRHDDDAVREAALAVDRSGD